MTVTPLSNRFSVLDRMRERVHLIGDLGALPSPPPLVDGLFNQDTLSLVYGRSGAGKSFFTLDIAMCVASGVAWHGQPVTQGPVLWVAAEGVRSIAPRSTAWMDLHHVFDSLPVHVLAGAVDLRDAVEVRALTELAREVAPRLVVFDTLARCARGAEENSATDMGQVVGNADELRSATGACVLLVHHAGKDARQGARGSTALTAAVDTAVEVRGGDRITVTVEKERDGETGASWSFVLTPAAGSVALTRTGDRVRIATLTQKQQDAFQALLEVATEAGVSHGTWKQQAGLHGIGASTFDTCMKALVDVGSVQKTGTGRNARYRPLTSHNATNSPTVQGQSSSVQLDHGSQSSPVQGAVGPGLIGPSAHEQSTERHGAVNAAAKSEAR